MYVFITPGFVSRILALWSGVFRTLLPRNANDCTKDHWQLSIFLWDWSLHEPNYFHNGKPNGKLIHLLVPETRKCSCYRPNFPYIHDRPFGNQFSKHFEVLDNFWLDRKYGTSPHIDLCLSLREVVYAENPGWRHQIVGWLAIQDVYLAH